MKRNIIKKNKANKNKILLVLTLILIIAFNLLLMINCVYAAELGNNVNLQYLGDCGSLLTYNGGKLKISYVAYNENGNLYPAYCLNRELVGVETVGTYSVYANNYIDDVGLWRRIINGYPYKSIEELGCKTQYEAFAATKQAIYCYIYGNDINKYASIGEAGQRTLNALKTIVNNAQNSNETKLKTNISINKVLTNWEQDSIDKSYISKEYEVNANTDFLNYEISISKTLNNELPEGVRITNLKNEDKTLFNKGEKFKILIPIKSLNKDGNFNINVKSKLKTKPVIYGTAPSSNLQNYALTMFQYENSDGVIEENYLKNDTKIVVYKQDKTSMKSLEGVVFNLLNDKKEVIKKDLKTDKNGKIIINDLVPGKYYLKEVKSLEGYEKLNEEIEININLNEKVEITVNNLKEVKKEVEKPKEDIPVSKEVKEVIKKLPVTGM